MNAKSDSYISITVSSLKASKSEGISIIIEVINESYRMTAQQNCKCLLRDLSHLHENSLDIAYRVLDKESCDIIDGKVSLVKKLLFYSRQQIESDPEFSFIIKDRRSQCEVILKLVVSLSGSIRKRLVELKEKIFHSRVKVSPYDNSVVTTEFRDNQDIEQKDSKCSKIFRVLRSCCCCLRKNKEN